MPSQLPTDPSPSLLAAHWILPFPPIHQPSLPPSRLSRLPRAHETVNRVLAFPPSCLSRSHLPSQSFTKTSPSPQSLVKPSPTNLTTHRSFFSPSQPPSLALPSQPRAEASSSLQSSAKTFPCLSYSSIPSYPSIPPSPSQPPV